MNRRTLWTALSGLLITALTAFLLIVPGTSSVAVPPGGRPTKKPSPTPTQTVTPTPTPTPTTASPTPTATATTTTTTPPAGQVIFQESFAPGWQQNWSSCQWKSGSVIFNSDCTNYTNNSMYSMSIANGGVGHEEAARFEVRNGDSPFSGTERSEIAEPLVNGNPTPAEVVEGDERWISWDMKFDESFPTPIGYWDIVHQWHDQTLGQSPPLAINIRNPNSDMIFVSNDEELVQTPIQNVQRGVWQHWEYHVKFSTNASVGFVEVLVDGEVKVPKEFRRTILAGDTGNYFKTGLYRDPANTATQIVWHDNITIRG